MPETEEVRRKVLEVLLERMSTVGELAAATGFTKSVLCSALISLGQKHLTHEPYIAASGKKGRRPHIYALTEHGKKVSGSR